MSEMRRQANSVLDGITAPGQVLSTNGYVTLPGGVIIQWGLTGVIPDDSTLTVTFPIPFPNACLNVNATEQYTGVVSGAHVLAITTITNTNFTVLADDVSTTTNANLKAYWIAIGY